MPTGDFPERGKNWYDLECEFNQRGCEFGRLYRSEIEMFHNRLDSKMEDFETWQTVMKDVQIPKLIEKVEASIKLSQEAISTNGQALKTVEDSKVLVEAAGKAVTTLTDKFNHLGWDLLWKLGTANIMLLVLFALLKHYKLV